MENKEKSYKNLYYHKLYQLMTKVRGIPGLNINQLELKLSALRNDRLSYGEFKRIIMQTVLQLRETGVKDAEELYQEMKVVELDKATEYLLGVNDASGTIKENCEWRDNINNRIGAKGITHETLFNDQIVVGGLQCLVVPLNIRIFIKLALEKVTYGKVINDANLMDSVYAQINEINNLLEETVFSYTNVRKALERLEQLLSYSRNPYACDCLSPLMSVLDREEQALFNDYCSRPVNNIDTNKADFDAELAILREVYVVNQSNPNVAIKLEMIMAYIKNHFQTSTGDTPFQKKHIPGNPDTK